MDTCGQCKFGRPIPSNLTKRVCHGVPPDAFPAPGNGVATIRPIVESKDMACSVFKPMILGADDTTKQ